ncbi:hypothetical protein L1049_002821 [Liquidambar formosana]|uniref:Uncharacterized protein n=1 Tax=Liquidambar formosana TaxID=63359 RepID=A0AAP0NGD7_LIQFO
METKLENWRAALTEVSNLSGYDLQNLADGEISKQPSGLVFLQEHILSEFQMKDNQKIRNVDHGIEVIKRRVWSKRVLVVLDDVDDFEQLKALAIRRDWFQPGSRVIVLSNLKILNLSHSHNLTETPDFSGLINLDMLLLNDCPRWVEVHESIECLDKLLVLNLGNCKNLRKLPPGIFKLKSLQNLSLTGCSNIETLPGFKGSPSKSWFSHFSSWVSPMRNPDSISLAPTSMQGLISIRRLYLADCNLSYIPNDLGSLITLKVLNLDGNNFCSLPASIRHLSRLEALYLNRCTRLQSLPELPINLEEMNANHCTALERISLDQTCKKD